MVQRDSIAKLATGFALAAVMIAACSAAAAAGGSDGFSYAPYGRVLEKRVDARGRVDYAGLKAERSGLDAFVAGLAAVDRGEYETWGSKEKIAFWINAYNALTLEVIIDNYPIRPSESDMGEFPGNSIRQIPGVWDEIEFAVMGSPMTLNQIEHEVLRTQFEEPRIHMALVCASVGCPLLRREPFLGATLEDQLDDQTRVFLSLARNFQIDREKGTVHLSSIFDWFGDDFEGFGEEVDIPAGHAGKERAALNFIVGYLGEADHQYIVGKTYEVVYLPYDWSLNEQPSGTQ